MAGSDAPPIPPGRIDLLPDRPIRTAAEDAFGFVAYADAFALLINDRSTATPMTIALSGAWGSGKTSLARLIEERLAVRNYWAEDWQLAPLTCWFDAWRHADSPHIGATLAAQVARAANRSRPIWWRLISPLPSVMLTAERRWWRRLWIGCVGATGALLGLVGLMTLAPGLRDSLGPLGELPNAWTDLGLWWAAVPVGFALARRGFKVADSLGTLVQDPAAAAAAGTVEEARIHLGRIIRQALRGERRLVIFVDNLERCQSDKALGVCEMTNHLFDFDDVVTVLVADTSLLASAAKVRYSVDDSLPTDMTGERYLHKLIQLRFTLPPLGRTDVGRMFRPTTDGASS